MQKLITLIALTFCLYNSIPAKAHAATLVRDCVTNSHTGTTSCSDAEDKAEFYGKSSCAERGNWFCTASSSCQELGDSYVREYYAKVTVCGYHWQAE